MTTYLFYDIETTGLNKAFDQILQFSAIRTDMSFKEIDRVNLAIRLRPDVIPSPGALITHRIGMFHSLQGLAEYEAVGRIHRLFNMPGTVSLGYNTMGFDDEFLRFSFHRNLFPPYTHQYTNGCHRMDMLPFVIIFFLFKKEALIWPERNGKPTMKLEFLSSANGLTAGRAHDAQTDVLATLALAELFARHEEMWRYVSGYFHKATDGDRLSRLPVGHRSDGINHTMGLLIGSEFGPELQYQAPVLYIGDSVPYANQTLWLRLDLPELQKAVPNDTAKSTWVIRKRLGEPPIILPPLSRFMALLNNDRKGVVRENLDWICAHPALFQEIIHFHQQYRYPEIPDLDPDAALYRIGFLSHSETKVCRRFHTATPAEKAQIISQFPREEIRSLAARILFRNYPEFAPRAYAPAYESYLRRVNAPSADEALCDYKGAKRTTPAEALMEIDRLRKESSPDADQNRLLTELADYLAQRVTQ